jgi:30S ribosomal protein S31
MCLLLRAGIFPDQTRQRDHIMGRGDKRTGKGKTFKGSYGNTRPHSPAKKAVAKKPAGKKS